MEGGSARDLLILDNDSSSEQELRDPPNEKQQSNGKKYGVCTTYFIQYLVCMQVVPSVTQQNLLQLN